MTTPFKRPKSYNANQLDQVGVQILNLTRVHLKCKTCGTVWFPNSLSRERLPRNYWKCPKGCNKEAK
jgi:hypothetical protein